MMQSNQGKRQFIDVKYIESNGTQYIDTGIIIKNTDRIKIVAKDIKGWVFGCVNRAGASDDIGVNANAIRFGTMYVSGLNLFQQKQKVYLDRYGYQIDDIYRKWETIAGIVVFKSCFLLWARGSSAEMSGKVYEFEIADRMHFVPKYDRKEKRPCMFDTVTQQSFYNSGTGEFGYELLDGIYVAPT